MRLQLNVLVINFIVCMFLLDSSFAQTAQQLGARFTPAKAYWLSPGILMLTRFDPSVEICEALIEPMKENGAKPETMSEKIADEMIEQVAPLESRGESESRYLDPDSAVGGGVYNLKSNFKFVSVEKMGNVSRSNREDTIQVIRVTWTKRTCVGTR